MTPSGFLTWFVLAFLSMFLCVPLQADELRTLSGERLVGKIVSVNDRTVVFWSPNMGSVTLARSNVATISLGPLVSTNSVAHTNSPALTSTNSDLAAVLKSLPSQPGLAENVTGDMLAQAGPEATAKFNQMLKGLLTGSMSMADLRREATSVRDQARAMRKDLGDEAGGILDSYLAILDKFLAEGPPAQNVRTNPAR